ncbi:hypothetical protein JKG47_22485 [Acidithiobacillus sp. MC6.1]|nr:hypothetical protein [Acidithiobacillus sp. MC6.1]
MTVIINKRQCWSRSALVLVSRSFHPPADRPDRRWLIAPPFGRRRGVGAGERGNGGGGTLIATAPE